MPTASLLTRRLTAALLGVTLLVTVTDAGAQDERRRREIHVAVNGTDSRRCGSRFDPCRSITQAINVAREGDTILVGPGRYGDVDIGPDLKGAGDEHPDAALECMVCIDKRVRVLSTHGPAQTAIQEADIPVGALVLIRANGVTFGRGNQGFTLYGRAMRAPDSGGARVGLAVQGASDVRVEGNIVTAVPGAGLRIDAADGPIRVSRNQAIGNEGPGFIVTRSGEGYVWLLRNEAVANRAEGFQVEGAHLVVANSAHTNLLDGFAVSGSGSRFFHNVSTNHLGGDGFRVDGSNHHFTRTATHGNFFGFAFLSGRRNEIHESNIYGNRGNPQRTQVRCGVLNASSGTVVATRNFWGSRAGPGEYPADQAGAQTQCDAREGSVTVFEPFAREPFTITLERQGEITPRDAGTQ
jgi:hypothetical protein